MQASTLRIAIRTVLVVVACLTEGRLSWCGVHQGKVCGEELVAMRKVEVFRERVVRAIFP